MMTKLDRFKNGVRSLGKCLKCLDLRERHFLFGLLRDLGIDLELYDSVSKSIKQNNWKKIEGNNPPYRISYKKTGFYEQGEASMLYVHVEPEFYEQFFEVIEKTLLLQRQVNKIMKKDGWKNIVYEDLLNEHFCFTKNSVNSPAEELKMLKRLDLNRIEETCKKIWKAEKKIGL